MSILIELIKECLAQFMDLLVFFFLVFFVTITSISICAIYFLPSALLQVQLTVLGPLLYVIGLVLLSAAFFVLVFCILAMEFLFHRAPLYANSVIFSVFRLLNLLHADFRVYIWCEVYLSLVSLYCALQYMINQRIMYKFKWIRREFRLLGAVCYDVSESFEVEKHMNETYYQILNSDSTREMIRLKLTEEEEQWVKTTKDVVGGAEPFIKAFPACTQNLLRRQLLFLQLYKVQSISKNISRQRNKYSVLKCICKKLENSRPKFQILKELLTEDESESTGPEQLGRQLTCILQKADYQLPKYMQGKLQWKLELMEAFLQDLDHVKFESAMEKAWFEEMKIFLGDIDNAYKTSKETRDKKGLLEKDVDWMADWLAELLEAKSIFGLKFTRIQQQTCRYQKDVLNNEDFILFDLNNIRGHPKLQTVISTKQGHQIISLCNRIERMHGDLKAIEDTSYFRLICSKMMRIITSKLKTDLDNYSEKMETSFIESYIKDIERFIGAYDFKVRLKSSSIIGLEEDTDAIVSKLTSGSEQCCVFSIVGMQGIGKTTLAKNVYHHKEIKSHFPHRIWVSVPKGFNDVNALLEDVANRITNTDDSKMPEKVKGKEQCLQKIQNSLQEKSYLLVFDNISTTTIWNELKGAFPESMNGSRILLTTRHMTVASQADQSKKPHQLRLRTKEESWEMLLEKVQFSLEILSQNELMKKGKHVVGSCWGLPLSLSSLGIQVAGGTVDSHQLSRAFVQVDQCKTLWSETLQSNDLPNNLRSLLSYFTLFPMNFEIPTRRLIALWIAEGLVELSSNEKNTLENIAEDSLLKLIGLNIIQPVEIHVNGKVKTCCLPNPLRDVVLYTSTASDQRLVDHTDSSIASFKLIHGADSDAHQPKAWRNYENLVSMISFDTRKRDKHGNNMAKFLCKGIVNGCFKKLKVLDLEHVFKPQLPRTVGKLIELRYLGLRWTYLEEIPSTVGNLLNLQTLDLKHTSIRTLPDTIWKLQKLHHLYLNQTYRRKFMHQSGTRYLHSLRTLSGAFLYENSPLKDHLDELKSLRKLNLAFQLSSRQQKDLAKRIANLEHLKSLKLRSVSVKSEPEGLYLGNFSALKSLSSMHLSGRLENEPYSSKFPAGLSDLTLLASGLQYDPMEILEKLPNLRSLCLFSNSFTGERMVCSKGGFPQLLVLKIQKLDSLRDWIIREQAMQKLKELEIRSCPLLQVPEGLGNLKTLRELKPRDMPERFNTGLVEYRRLIIPYFITHENQV